MEEFGMVHNVPLRDLWAGEATHFTPWLAQHLDVLGKKLGMDLELESTEGAAGDFSVDIIARDLSTERRHGRGLQNPNSLRWMVQTI